MKRLASSAEAYGRRSRFRWRLNLAAHPLEPAPAIVALWIGLALVGLSLLSLDLYLIGQESFKMYRLYHKRNRYRQLAMEERERIRRFKKRIQTLDTPRFRDECAFLKEQVEARLFSWSHLLNDLEAVLPPGIRIVSISPTIDRETGRPGMISIQAEARSLKDFTDMVAAFYRSGRFQRVKILRESPNPNQNVIRYDFTVRYRLPAPVPSTPEVGS